MAEKKRRDEEIEDEEAIEAVDKRRINWQAAKDKALHYGHKADKIVRENPWKSVAISAAIGAGVALAAAAIIGSRRQDSFLDKLKNLF